MSKDNKKHISDEETEEILEQLKSEEAAGENGELQTEDQTERQNAVEYELENMKREYEQLNDRYVRLYADFDNFKRRANKEKYEISTYAISGIMSKLIEVKDNFERALGKDEDNDTPFYNGMKMVAKQLDDILTAEGLSAIKAVGEVFDPNMHYAVMTDNNSEIADDVIVEQLQTGYIFKEKVIRPAMVKVNKL